VGVEPSKSLETYVRCSIRPGGSLLIFGILVLFVDDPLKLFGQVFDFGLVFGDLQVLQTQMKSFLWRVDARVFGLDYFMVVPFLAFINSARTAAFMKTANQVQAGDSSSHYVIWISSHPRLSVVPVEQGSGTIRAEVGEWPHWIGRNVRQWKAFQKR